eukprot:1003465-Pleurochrysis_carterae.AAC.2
MCTKSCGTASRAWLIFGARAPGRSDVFCGLLVLVSYRGHILFCLYPEWRELGHTEFRQLLPWAFLTFGKEHRPDDDVRAAQTPCVGAGVRSSSFGASASQG